MKTTIDRNGLAWGERETAYGRAHDLEGAPPGSCGFSVLEVDPARESSPARHPIAVAMFTMVMTGFVATWLIL